MRTLIVSTNRETNIWRQSTMEAHGSCLHKKYCLPPYYEAESLGGSIWRKTTQQAAYPSLSLEHETEVKAQVTTYNDTVDIIFMPIPSKLVRELSANSRYCSNTVPQTEKPLECWHYLATCLSGTLIDCKTDALVDNNNTK